MRLESLSLRNWGVHSSLDVDLSSGLEISGRNGTGKSSILEALRFMFAKTGRNYSFYVQNGEREAECTLSFTFDGHRYRASKQMYVDKSSKASLLRDDVFIADNPSSMYAQLQNILDEDVLEKLLYVRQGELTLILERLSGREGKTELDRLFGLDQLERVWLSAGDEVKELEGELNVLNDELKRHPENAWEKYMLEVDGLEEKRGRVLENSSNLSRESQNLEAELAARKSEMNRLEKDFERIGRLKERFGKLQLESARLEVEAKNISEKISVLEGKRGEISVLEKEVSNLELLRNAVRWIDEAKNLGERVKDFGDVDAKMKRLEELGQKGRMRQEVEKRFIDLQEQVKKLEEEQTTARTLLNRVLASKKSLEGLAVDSKCPRCGQTLTSEHVFHERKRLILEEEDLKNASSSASEKLNELRGWLDEYSGKLKRYVEFEAEARQLEEQVSEVKKSREKVEGELRECLSKISSNGFRIDEGEDLRGRLRDVESKKTRLEMLLRDVAELQTLGEKLSRVSERKNSVDRENAELSSQITGIPVDEAKLKGLRDIVEELSARRFKVLSKIENSGLELKTIEDSLRNVLEKQKHYTELWGKHGDVSQELDLLKRARKVFHRDHGLVKYLRDRFLAQLSVYLTQYFKRFNQNPKYRQIKFNQDYSLELKTTSGMISLQQLSGGEKAQIALALRLALIDLMSPTRLLILDEPFGSLDEQHRRLLGESLNRLALAGQLILVTHVEVDGLELPRRLELAGY
ncbi:MAG TPA: SMC family ATPase [Candidatus Altiarchaeales archaeon]|nr:SMC family ATPase [Candidatus Altiarchaeales archaeon]